MDPNALRDLHLPNPIGFWPLATGWWIVIISLLSIFAIFVILNYLYRRPNALRSAQAEVDRIFALADITDAQRDQKVSLTLKQLAISSTSREEVAHLTGEPWISWIESRIAKGTLSGTMRAYLANGPYSRGQLLDIDASELQRGIHSVLSAIAKPKKQDDPRSMKRWANPFFQS